MLNRLPREDSKVSLPHYGIGIVNYHTYEDVSRCIASAKQQSHAPSHIVLIDGDSIPEPLERLHQQYPEVTIERRPNQGFAAGANRALATLQGQASKLSFMLLLNPDVLLAPDFAERVLEDMLGHPRAALASGKLLRPGEDTIDSTGIVLPPNRRPRDRGSEELDVGQYDRSQTVFAASGAVLMLRAEALADLEVEGEIFDEDFFMYHEDTDLSWRARNLGWQARYVHDACAIHTRRWRPRRRFDIAPQIRRHSFKNHYLQMIKNDRLRDVIRDLPAILGWEAVRLGYAVLRDRAMLPSYLQVLRMAPRAWRKRGVIKARMSRHPRITSSPVTRG